MQIRPENCSVQTSHDVGGRGGGGGVGYTRFQEMGMIEGFFSFEIFDSRIF